MRRGLTHRAGLFPAATTDFAHVKMLPLVAHELDPRLRLLAIPTRQPLSLA